MRLVSPLCKEYVRVQAGFLDMSISMRDIEGDLSVLSLLITSNKIDLAHAVNREITLL